jgi:hypothetical protein
MSCNGGYKFAVVNNDMTTVNELQQQQLILINATVDHENLAYIH